MRKHKILYHQIKNVNVKSYKNVAKYLLFIMLGAIFSALYCLYWLISVLFFRITDANYMKVCDFVYSVSDVNELKGMIICKKAKNVAKSIMGHNSILLNVIGCLLNVSSGLSSFMLKFEYSKSKKLLKKLDTPITINTKHKFDVLTSRDIWEISKGKRDLV